MNIISLINKVISNRRTRRINRRNEQLRARYRDQVQAMEWQGKLYISIGGAPIISIDKLAHPEQFIGYIADIRDGLLHYAQSVHAAPQ